MNPDTQNITTLSELEEVFRRFIELLEQEQNILLNPVQAPVDAIVVKKRSLLQRINCVHPELAAHIENVTDSDKDHAVIAEIKKSIYTCKERNRENGALVAQRLKVCRSAIGFLHSNLHQGTIELYTSHGHTQSELSTRVIGQA